MFCAESTMTVRNTHIISLHYSPERASASGKR